MLSPNYFIFFIFSWFYREKKEFFLLFLTVKKIGLATCFVDTIAQDEIEYSIDSMDSYRNLLR